MGMKKGLFFTTDAFMAMILLSLGIILMSKLTYYEQPIEQILIFFVLIS